MINRMRYTSPLLLVLSIIINFSARAGATTADGKRKWVITAGKPSHGPRQHEFRAGSLLFQKCLANVPGLVAEVPSSGWPKLKSPPTASSQG